MTDPSVNNAAAASAKPCPGGETASANCGKGVVVQGTQQGKLIGQRK